MSKLALANPDFTIDPPARRGWTIAGFDWQRLVGIGFSVAVLGMVAWHVGRGGLDLLARSYSYSPAFWATFAALYAVPSLAEWAIFRRLWRLPLIGYPALLRKQVANELVLGYSGDAHFYLWAHRHLAMKNSPFGAVKDVAILSAVAGNIVTLVLMIVSWPLLLNAIEGPLAHTFAWSVALIAASSLVMFGFRRTLFSLAAAELRFVFAVHVARILGCLALLALLAHLILPSIAFGALLTLVTLRMMLSRLPLIPAKDAVFAGLIALLYGEDARIVPAMVLIAGLTLATHLVVGVATTLPSFLPQKTPR